MKTETYFPYAAYANLGRDDLNVFIAAFPEYAAEAMLLANKIRERNISVQVDARDAKVKSKIKFANGRKAYFFLAIGEEEVKSGIVSVKDLDGRAETDVLLENVPYYILHGLWSY